MRKGITSEKGAAAVEFALVLPLLMLILWGIIEFSLLLYNKQVITNASREGARAGIVADPRLNAGQIETIAENYCSNYLISFKSGAIPTAASNVCASFSDPLTVTVSYPYQFLALQGIANLFGGSIGPEINLSAVTVMRCE